VSVQGMSVGLDVHARSVVACALDGWTGELTEARLTPDYAELLAWLGRLPGPVAVTYEAGPTGFGLARFLSGAGVECLVAAPSKLQRPSGDRVKIDARDARHLARLLHLGEVVAVTVLSADTEAARDLVRAREDVRGDLMSARHRVSKLLLRQGIVYSGGKAWTGVHDRWLRAQKFASPALALTYETTCEAMLAAVDRRDRLDAAIAVMAAQSQFTPVASRLGCLRGVSTLTAFGLAVEIGDWHRLDGSRIGAYLGLVPTESSSGSSRSQGGITKTGNGHPDGCWSRRPGTTASPTGIRGSTCADGGTWRARPHEPGARRPTGGCTPAGTRSTSARIGPSWPTPRSPASSPAGAGRWQCSRTADPPAR